MTKNSDYSSGSSSSSKRGWAFLSPTLIFLILVGLIPFIYVIYLSFFDYNIFSVLGKVFSGLENYRMLIQDSYFLQTVFTGLKFVAIACSIELFLGFWIAQLLKRKFLGRGLVRALYTLPLTLAPITVGSAWLLLTRPGPGPIPYILNDLMGLEYNISTNGTQAFFTVVAMDIWHWTPLVSLALLAGLSSLPVDPYEAARVDGAGGWMVFRKITWPQIRALVMIILFLRIMDSFRIFDEVWMLTGGGPADATRFVSIHLVRTVLAQSNYGYGASMSVFVLYLVIVIVWLLLVLLRRESE